MTRFQPGLYSCYHFFTQLIEPFPQKNMTAGTGYPSSIKEQRGEGRLYLHFFIGGCDWYVAEYDGDDLFWGYVILNNDHVKMLNGVIFRSVS